MSSTHLPNTPHPLNNPDLRISEQIKRKEIFYTVEHIFTDLSNTGIDLDVAIKLLRERIEEKIPQGYAPDISDWSIHSEGVGSPHKGCTIRLEDYGLSVTQQLPFETFDVNYALARSAARQVCYFLENASIWEEKNFDFLYRDTEIFKLTFVPIPTLCVSYDSYGNLPQPKAAAIHQLRVKLVRQLKVKVLDYLTKNPFPAAPSPKLTLEDFTIEDHLNAIKILLELQNDRKRS